MGMRAVWVALCRIWIAVGTCSCSEYKECSYSHSSMRAPVLQCASIMKHTSRFTFLTPADISKIGITHRINVLWKKYSHITGSGSWYMTFCMGFTGNQKLHAPLLIAHSQQFYSPFCLHFLLKIKYDLTTGNFFQAALWGTFKHIIDDHMPRDSLTW